MTTERARQLLGVDAQNLSDKELEELLNSLSALADIFIEQSIRIVDVKQR